MPKTNAAISPLSLISPALTDSLLLRQIDKSIIPQSHNIPLWVKAKLNLILRRKQTTLHPSKQIFVNKAQRWRVLCVDSGSSTAVDCIMMKFLKKTCYCSLFLSCFPSLSLTHSISYWTAGIPDSTGKRSQSISLPAYLASFPEQLK